MSSFALREAVLTGFVVIAINGLALPSVQAQSPSDEDEIEEVVVTGVRASIIRAIDQKRLEQGLSDSISAEDLGKFPDLNLSESLQRIPGVALNRNPNGEGEAINLRGLAPQFTRVEINGVTALGNGADQNINGRLGGNGGGREFNFEILPAELFSNATVNKTASASQGEGGLAGSVSLDTNKPLDHEGFKFSGSVQGNYGDKNAAVDPRLFFGASNNFNGVFGISGALAHSTTNFRSDAIEGGTWHRLSAITNNVDAGDTNADVLVARTPRLFSFLEDRENTAGVLNLQYRPNDNIEVFGDLLFAELTNKKNAVRPDIVLEGSPVAVVLNDPDNPFVVQNGIATGATFEGVQHRPSSRLVDINDQFFQASGGVKFTTGQWTITPFLGTVSREADRLHSLLSFRANDAAGAVRTGPEAYLTYRLEGDYLNFSSALTDLRTKPEDFSLNVLIFRPTVDKDKEDTFKLDFERNLENTSGLANVKFGIRFNNKEKTVNAQEYRLRRTGGSDAVVGFEAVDVLVDFNVDGSNDPFSQRGQIFTVDPQLFLDVYFPNGFNGVNSTGLLAGTEIDNRPGRGASRSYSVIEETFNAYIESNFEQENFSFNAGLRFVSTDQQSNGSIVTNQDQSNEQISPVSISSSYERLLPSASLRYSFAEDLLFRAAYSLTLTRANLPDLSPAESIFVPDATTLGTGNRGNPNLRPSVSENIDIALEWYFEEASLLSIAYFHKQVDDLIGTTVSTETRTFLPQVGTDLVTGPVAFNVPTNAASATIEGFELSIQHSLSFLGEKLQPFGYLFNYTYTDSKADFGIVNDVRANGLPGLSKSSYNAAFYYDNGWLDVRLSYAWRERYLAAFSDDFALPRFIDDYGQLDLSANLAFKNVQFQLQVLNLAAENIISQAFVQGTGYLPYGVLDTSTRVLFGVRYSFRGRQG